MSGSVDDDSPPPDLVIRIALLRGDDDLRELSPSIWRRFRCNSAVNLDAFQDKILQPVMGWTRNYHTYYFSKDSTYYFQGKSSSADNMGMHDRYRAVGGERVDPTDFELGDLLLKKGDSCYYAYDLGDHWYHKLTVEDVIEKSDDDANFGKCAVLDGAMRCPGEDGKGGDAYQKEVLDFYNLTKSNPANVDNIRKFAKICFDLVNVINVQGIFDVEDFTVDKTQDALQRAIRSRISERMGNKSPAITRTMLDIQRVSPGQRKKRFFIQDLRGEKGPPHPHRPPWFMPILEIVNLKPDEDKFAVCANCGNPNDLKQCSRCHTARYCSRDCQVNDWPQHKKECKKDKRFNELYEKEKSGDVDVPQDEIPGERSRLKKFDADNMRFEKGTKVECLLQDNVYGTGKIKRVLHEYDGLVHAYQVQLDKKTANKMGIPHEHALIWADWDCDYQIRKWDRGSGHVMQIVD